MKMKFWDKEEKRMMGPDLDTERYQIISYNGLALIDDEREDEGGWPYQMDVGFLRYTQVNETETGREIYEGDIVDYDDTAVMGGRDRISQMRGVVEMSEGCWWITDDSKKQSVRLWSETAEIKIVGNIYENPELLK